MVTLPSMRIRPAHAADVDKMLDLLEPEEFVQPLTRAQLRRLFDYEWANTKINFGIVLEAGESVVGMAATVYSPVRRIDGRDVITLNSGTLFIRPRYRARRTGDSVTRFSEEVARAGVARTGVASSVSMRSVAVASRAARVPRTSIHGS